jgi:hypothetical protein
MPCWTARTKFVRFFQLKISQYFRRYCVPLAVIFTNAAVGPTLEKVGRPCCEGILPLTRNVAWVSDVEPLVHDSVEVTGIVGGGLCKIRHT